MSLDAVSFEAAAPALEPHPVRMDVVCFIGLVAERRGVDLPGDLVRWIGDRGYARPAALNVAGERLFNIPVPIESVETFEGLFDPDTRIDRVAELAGRALPDALPGDADPVIHVVLDGVIREIALGAPPATPQALIDAISASGVSVTARLEGRRLVLGRPEALGRGDFAVLANDFGFPEAVHSRAGPLATPLAQAVRQFFALGGRRAYVLRMGDPVPYLAPRLRRLQAMRRMLVADDRLELTLPQLLFDLAGELPRADIPTPERYGPTHLFGLEDAGLVVLPDLPDLAAPPPEAAEPPAAAVAPPEVFAECLPVTVTGPDTLAERLAPPVLDAAGAPLWRGALDRMLRLIQSTRRDMLMIASEPRPLPDVALSAHVPKSAFLQIAGPWARTALSAPLPGRFIGPDAVLAGRIASDAVTRGAFLSIAGQPVPELFDVEPGQSKSPWLSRLERTPSGIRFESDLTTSAELAWVDGPVSRLMALLIRHALRLGADLPFEPSGPALWRQVRSSFERLLEPVRLTGGIAGTGRGEGYSVRCGRDTMSQQDIDAGRLIAEVEFAPVPPIQGITVVLPLFTRGGGGVR